METSNKAIDMERVQQVQGGCLWFCRVAAIYTTTVCVCLIRSWREHISNPPRATTTHKKFGSVGDISNIQWCVFTELLSLLPATAIELTWSLSCLPTNWFFTQCQH